MYVTGFLYWYDVNAWWGILFWRQCVWRHGLIIGWGTLFCFKRCYTSFVFVVVIEGIRNYKAYKKIVSSYRYLLYYYIYPKFMLYYSTSACYALCNIMFLNQKSTSVLAPLTTCKCWAVLAHMAFYLFVTQWKGIIAINSISQPFTAFNQK